VFLSHISFFGVLSQDYWFRILTEVSCVYNSCFKFGASLVKVFGLETSLRFLVMFITPVSNSGSHE
jgi:hypothetical protein